MAAFGFSVGDFVTCLQLIREVAQALSNSRGSAAEYQSLFQTLVSLNQGLAASELIYLQWNTEATGSAYKKNGAAMINGILFERQKCKLLMENFLKASQPYADAFVKERGKAVVRSWRKVTWLFQKEEVNKLEKELQRHLQALRIYTDALFQNQTAANAEMMGSQVGSILADVANLRTDVSIMVNALKSWDSPRKKSLGYPWEASASLSDNVLLLDATGRSVLLPMLFLSSPVVLHDLLNIMYRGIPGHRRILRHQYNITDEDADGILVEESNWNDIIRPGMQLSLNVILQASSSWNIHRCPRCGEAVLGQVLQGKRRRCQKCQLTFRVFDTERVVEESEVACDSSSADNKDSNVDPKASSRHSADGKSRTHLKDKNNIAEDYLFQRVHYQRDIKKIELIKNNVSVREEDNRKLELNELPPLHRAAASGLLLEIESLLDSGEEINAKMPYQAVIFNDVSGNFYFEGCTPLQLASYFGRGKVINLLLDRGASLTVQDAAGGEALAYAILGEDSGVTITLLARGADIHAADYAGRTALHLACTLNIQWLVRLLLQQGADAAFQDKSGDTPLHNAVRFGDGSVLNILLDTGPDFSIRNTSGIDLLHTACIYGREKAAKILLDYGADITSRDRDGDTPFHDACWNGTKALVKILLEHGADVACRGSAGTTPLHYACFANHPAVVDILLESGSDMYAQNDNECDSVNLACFSGSVDALKVLLDNDFKFTRDHLINYPLLRRASYDGFDKIVRLLVERGIKINDIKESGSSPLQFAAWRGHVKAVETLLDLGASHTYQDDEGKTALHSSTIESNGEVTRLLLKRGADHTIRDTDQCDPLLRALWNGNEPVAKILLEHGASLTSRDSLGSTPLIVASGEGLEDVVKLLLDAGVDINAASNVGRTALHRACYGGHDSIVKLLLARGADPIKIDTDGRLPLHDAANFSSAETVRLFLEHGVDPAAKREDGVTTLYCAADCGNFDSVKILLESGKVDIDAQDDNGGLTALHAAAILGFTKIVELLIEHGADVFIRDKEGNTYQEYVKP